MEEKQKKKEEEDKKIAKEEEKKEVERLIVEKKKGEEEKKSVELKVVPLFSGALPLDVILGALLPNPHKNNLRRNHTK